MTFVRKIVALVVDDVRENRMVLSRILERNGFETVSVDCGEAAVQAALAKSFDIIFMDVMMPGMNGIEATSQIRSNGFVGPIIAVTAALTERENCIQCGMNEFVTKPVIFDSFLKKIPEWLSEKLKVTE